MIVMKLFYYVSGTMVTQNFFVPLQPEIKTRDFET